MFSTRSFTRSLPIFASIGTVIYLPVISSSTCDDESIPIERQYYDSIVQGPFPKVTPSPIAWNENWDRKKEIQQKEKAKAVHQIILVRHGQYHHEPQHDHEHVLTDLGKLQASLTGKRLQELLEAGIVHKINRVYYSTMTRATETWHMIEPVLKAAQLLPPATHIEPCSMIREGAVCPPIPASDIWKPRDFYQDQQRVRVVKLQTPI